MSKKHKHKHTRQRQRDALVNPQPGWDENNTECWRTTGYL